MCAISNAVGNHFKKIDSLDVNSSKKTQLLNAGGRVDLAWRGEQKAQEGVAVESVVVWRDV